MTNTFIHSFNIDSLKGDFQTIVSLHADVVDKKELLMEKLSTLKTIYNELIKTNNKKIFLFCLDSFYFQYKLLDIEMKNISSFINLINNRMYGDYYKLYNIMILQIKERIPDILNLFNTGKKHPIYKDLEPFYEYEMENIIDIHNDILKIIDELHRYYVTKETKIQNYNDTNKIGNSIINFINTLEYENSLLREQMTLYFNYVTFFHNTQKEHLTKILNKMSGFKKEIEEDIMINRPNILYANHNNNITFCTPTDSTFKLNIDETQLNEYLTLNVGIEPEEEGSINRSPTNSVSTHISAVTTEE